MKLLARLVPLSALAVLVWTAVPAPAGAEPSQARLRFKTDHAAEWERMESIRRGELLPTAVHTIPEAESAVESSAAESSTAESSVGIFAGTNLFALGWSGLDSGRWSEDSPTGKDTSYTIQQPSYRNRFALAHPALEFGVYFGSERFYGTTSIDFNTDTFTWYSTKQGESGITGFWNPLDVLSWWIFPETGYLSYADDRVTLAAGRFPSGIGFGNTNLFLNGQASFYDQIQFSWRTDKFRFFSMAGTSASHLNEEEYAVQNMSTQWIDEEGELRNSWGWDVINNHDASTQTIVPIKFFTYHRIEFKPASRIGFGVSEMQIVGGKAPELANLLPTVYWHNTYSAGISNVMILADIWIAPVRSLMLWGEYLMDDSKSPAEDELAKPRSWGWSFGGTFAPPVHVHDFRFSLSAEYSHVDRWTYNRWQPWLTMYQRHVLTGGYRGFDTPLGHPEGGDVDSAELRLTALSRRGARLEVGYSYTAKGPVYLGRIWTGQSKPDGDGNTQTVSIPVYYDFDYWYGRLVGDGKVTLDGLLGSAVKHTHALSAALSWPLPHGFEADAGFDIRVIMNAEHIEGKRALETVWKTGLVWRYDKTRNSK
ncbi:MAG TPA: capsule assembly Wzi family protein [Treponemataceae bacterium]|nr:capsule assembly Wzi family protein [Treponemataceae bacterium]